MANFFAFLTAFLVSHLPGVTMLILSLINELTFRVSLFESPLLDFVPIDNNERPDELDMLLETLSENDIQLLDSRVRDDRARERQQDHNKIKAI